MEGQMSIDTKFASAAEARRAGWFSRRHETNAAHRAEQEKRDKELADKKIREELQAEATKESKAEKLTARLAGQTKK